MRSAHSTKNLHRLYEHRTKLAEARVQEQQQEVAKTLKELQERKAIVDQLDKQIEENWQFLETAKLNTSAVVIQSANRHRYWIDYDKQRESFYLQLTYDELAEKQSELKVRQLNLAKIIAKRDTFKKLEKQQQQKKNIKQQRIDEAEFELIDTARRLRRVQ